ncbi:MAG: hypothetical protein GEU74_07280 [Nitriliruptorales bacterium]|nr:hypothetical protein [Nitriliruptorales bacterium]
MRSNSPSEGMPSVWPSTMRGRNRRGARAAGGGSVRGETLKQPEAVVAKNWRLAVAVLNSIELEGVSADSWKHAAQEALKEAAKTLRNIQRLDILGTSAVVGDGGVLEYRTRVRLLFEVDRSRSGPAG